MNIISLLALLAFLILPISINAQVVTIPDAVFKNVLINENCVDTDGVGGPDSDADLNNDGEIQVSEAIVVTRLYLFGYNINSLEGIESFVSLTYLNCHSNNLTSLNVANSTNLVELLCYNNELPALDVTQNTALQVLECSSNNLVSLDVSQNLELVTLGCSWNEISSLDVTALDQLENLYCQFNQITSLDVSQNPLLINLHCYFNLLSSLDVTQNPELVYLFCEHNQLTSLALQNPRLNNFMCNFNQLSSLDVSSCTDLVRLDCANNELVALDVSQNHSLQILTSHDNALTSLDLRNGNTVNTDQMWTFNNPELLCILVDDVTIIPECNMGQTSGWCKDPWSEYSEECIMGLAENDFSSIVIYPNPSNQFLNITSAPHIAIETIAIYSVLGNLVLEEAKQTDVLDISALSNGFYFIAIKTTQGLTTRSFIKE